MLKGYFWLYTQKLFLVILAGLYKTPSIEFQSAVHQATVLLALALYKSL